MAEKTGEKQTRARRSTGESTSPAATGLPAPLEIRKLQVDRENYQRELNEARVEEILAAYDEESLGIPLINQRPDGSYWIVDGQHRVEVLKRRGETHLTRYELIRVATIAEEAAIFTRRNAGHVRPNPAVLFLSRIAQKEPAALAIRRIVQEEGLVLRLKGKKEEETELTIPAVLDEIYRDNGEDGLREVLRFVRDTWNGQPRFASSAVVNGVRRFYDYYGNHPAFDREKAREIFSQFEVSDLLKEAKKVSGEYGYHRHVAFANAMQMLYNQAVKGGKKRHIYRVS